MFHKNINDLYVINPSLYQQKVVFYGAGDYSHSLYRSLVRNGVLELIGIYDNNIRKEKQWGNVKILSRVELEGLEKEIPIIIATKHMEGYQEIVHDLLELGFQNIYGNLYPAIARPFDVEVSKKLLEAEQKNFDVARSLLADEESKRVFDTVLAYRLTNDYRLIFKIREKRYRQYFPEGEIFEPEDKEVFIDAGSLNALSVCDFKEWTQDKYDKAYSFEPSEEDKVIVDEMIDFYKLRAISVDTGLYNYNGVVKFSVDNVGGSCIKNDGETEIKVVRLDDFMKDKNERVTFIKMDIEGSELRALEGGSRNNKERSPQISNMCLSQI